MVNTLKDQCPYYVTLQYYVASFKRVGTGVRDYYIIFVKNTKKLHSLECSDYHRNSNDI
jgi:hypothetical protein